MTSLVNARRNRFYAYEALCPMLEEAANYDRTAHRLLQAVDPAKYTTLIRMCEARAEEIRDTALRRADLSGLDFSVLEKRYKGTVKKKRRIA